MILRLRPGTPDAKVQALRDRCEREGLRTVLSPESARPVFAVVDKAPAALAAELRADPSVEELIQPQGDWRLVHRSFRERPTTVKIGGVRVGGGEVVVIAGPCSVEGRELVLEVAQLVRRAGAQLLRGGAFKPRTSPYSFQGFGVEGLRQLKDAGAAVGLPVVSEIMDASNVPAFVDHAIDCLQIGARNMQNFTLLKAVATAGRPVLLKRGLAATVEEWLYSAEYLAHYGCADVVLCERGIRTFETATRNTLDLTILPLLREWTHLPILVDPAHAAGIARIIPPLSRAAIAAGADGVAVEVHPRPEEARSDGPQALLPAELTALVADARIMAAVTGRSFHPPPAAACS
ncbi:MAG: 3-deoxy-7-phosphoheptulonate synthase [Planctomycetota bacterium]|nr:MAG: 3-deoxy-7-phosphoheptulonate synthase [Planctomycetota bacterium]